MTGGSPCPCGAARPYAGCCGPYHRAEAAPATAEDLMRSRYSAFVLGDAVYLIRSWHPSTRPRRLDLDPGVRWSGLEIVRAAGGVFDTDGTVEFKATHARGVQHEVSRFRREGGRWYYLDGVAGGRGRP